MRSGTTSHTASDNALLRALDARRPPADRIADDQLAAHFLPRSYRALVGLARFGVIRRVVEAVIDVAWPGPRRGVVARTRYIDDVAEAQASSVDQVLILGAGFDTRAHRLAALQRVPVFEVDHPATQATKVAALGHAVGGAPNHVTYAAVDFLTDDVGEVLHSSGFAPGLHTLVLWEGVTNYLDAVAVDTTFGFIADSVAAGSPVVFTYVDVAMIDGTGSFDGAEQSKRRVGRQGEPFTFGLDPSAVPAFLHERGFELVADVAVPALVKRYYGASQEAYAYYHVVDARRR